MQPLSALSSANLQSLLGIVSDIDDTLTHTGYLVADAYDRLVKATEAGLRVVLVTGRPLGFATSLAMVWPVNGAIAENGAVAVTKNRTRLKTTFFHTEEERQQQLPQLTTLKQQTMAQFDFAKLAGDSWLRVCDVAFDIGEAESLAPGDIAQMRTFLQKQGARTLQSSIHLHADFGNYDKAKMVERCAKVWWDETLRVTRDRYLFIGDSPNDEAGFAYFPLSVGVANVAQFAGRLKHPPRYVATKPGGHGFAEIIDTVLGVKV